MFVAFFMLTLGIDDAGRGPLIGPMILAGVILDKNGESFLKKRGIADSKTISHPVRIEMAKMIKETALGFYLVKSTPEEIDSSLTSGVNLNTLEAIKTASIINHLNDGKKMKVIVDCPSVNTSAWKGTLINYIKNSENLDILCEHKADANHVSVSAASILAKVAREEEVALIKNKFGDTGSGYPSDPFTIKFLKEHGKEFRDSGIFRKSWSTWKKLFPEKSQRSLGEF